MRTILAVLLAVVGRIDGVMALLQDSWILWNLSIAISFLYGETMRHQNLTTG
jgi:hypothetical protein